MSISALGLGFMVAMMNAAAAEPLGDKPVIVLFGASWCAPCRAELRILPLLASAAAPIRIEIAWIDRDPPASVRRAAPNVVVLSPSDARRKFATIAGGNQGLPVVAMIDGGGRPCAVMRQPAEVATIRSLIASCGR